MKTDQKSVLKTISLFIIRWQILSIITFILFWALWALIDFSEFNSDGYHLQVIFWDYSYCTTFTLCVLTICKMTIHALSKWMIKKWLFVVVSLICLAANILLSIVFEQLINHIIYTHLNNKIVLEGFWIYSIIATFLTVLLTSNYHYNLYISEFQKYKQNKLHTLQQQLNPHFLFNNLNALDALIEIDKDRAHIYLNKLSKFYRKFMKLITIDIIEIKDAIDVLENYIELLNVSFPQHFIVEIEKKAKKNENYILPLSLQLLIENAVKHNSHSEKKPIHIKIKYDHNYIIVQNTYRPIKSYVESSKNGLKNLNKRYLYFAGKTCIINQTEHLFEVKIPIIRKKS